MLPLNLQSRIFYATILIMLKYLRGKMIVSYSSFIRAFTLLTFVNNFVFKGIIILIYLAYKSWDIWKTAKYFDEELFNFVNVLIEPSFNVIF